MARTRTEALDAFAIVRVEPFHDHRPADFLEPGSGPEIGVGQFSVTVKEVVLDRAEAEREVERLNRLNETKGCRYFFQMTRLFADGGSFGSGG
jgi:hypothetical protein